MEMHQIRYFLALCDTRNFTRAAQLSYVSQPSLTQAIRKLEDEMGGELFLRTHSGCPLTELGRLVEPHLRHIYERALATKAEAIRFTKLGRVPLRIGLMKTIGARRLGPIFPQFQREFSNTELELIVDGEIDLLKGLQAGALDLVISAPRGVLGDEYCATLLYEERYVVVFKAGHRFGSLERIDLKAIDSEPYLDRLNCELREQVLAACEDRNINLYAAYRSNSEDWILDMVRAGVGIALIPEYTLPRNDDAVDFRYLEDPSVSRRVYVIAFRQKLEKAEVRTMVERLAGCRVERRRSG